MVLLLIGAFVFFILGLYSPWPKWLFWAACLLLVGFIIPVLWGVLGLLVIIKGMVALWRAVQD